jgi:hypothetical protein
MVSVIDEGVESSSTMLPTEDNPSTQRKISLIATLATTSAVWNGLKLNRFLRGGSTLMTRLHSGMDRV